MGHITQLLPPGLCGSEHPETFEFPFRFRRHAGPPSWVAMAAMDWSRWLGIPRIKTIPRQVFHGSPASQLVDVRQHIVRMLDAFVFRKHLCIAFELWGALYGPDPVNDPISWKWKLISHQWGCNGIQHEDI